MKMWKEENTQGSGNGYVICIKVGNDVYRSWWSSPPKDEKHFDLSYLRDRYCIIKSQKRKEKFQQLWNKMWTEVTEQQKELMEHCIGLGRSKKPYRNYFFTQEDDKDWNELVNKGLADKGKKHPNDDEFIYFWLTKQGVEFILNKTISDKYFKEL